MQNQKISESLRFGKSEHPAVQQGFAMSMCLAFPYIMHCVLSISIHYALHSMFIICEYYAI